MKVIKFLAALAATYGIIALLNAPLQQGATTIPPIGPLFNPFTGFWCNAEPLTGPALPPQVRLAGLTGKAEVIYDDMLVPHIFAENDLDAMMLQGYITAQHRLFQMDLTARKVSGRLSEIIGERTLNVDKMSRRKGLGYAAEKDLEHWQKNPEEMKLITAYAAGVNAWIDQLQPASYPIEFKLLGYQPEHWTPFKAACVVEGMADMLADYDDDIEATNALQLLGEETYKALYPVWNSKQKPVIPEGFYPKSAEIATPTPPTGVSFGEIKKGAQSPLDIDPAIEGSNNWAVGGSKSASGQPILCNDPHLGLSLPSIWYQVHIHTPTSNRYGVTLPGAPGVIIGFNENIAWGITNVGVDVSDWYRIQWADAGRANYLLDGQPTPVSSRIESISVKGRKNPVLDTVKYTFWGPLVYDDPKAPLFDCAFRWSAHDTGSTPAGQFAQLNHAKNFADYTLAITGFDCPAQNFVFACKDGDIALRVQGNLPIRKNTEGRFIQDGSQRANGWRGFIPQDQIPKMHNPSRGFVASANQNSTAPSYPYYAPYGDWEQYRGRRVVNWLESMQQATVDSMKAMQNSNFSYRAYEAKRAMLQLVNTQELNAAEQALFTDLSQWNSTYNKDLTAPTLFEMWFDSTYRLVFDEIMVFKQQQIPIQMPHSWRLIDLFEKDTSHIIFDIKNTPARETARQVVNQAFHQMSAQATIEAAKGQLVWGKVHSLTIGHLARIAPFSRSNIPNGGHRSALNATERDYGPSWRMIVELGDQVKAIGVYPGGQSGNPGSRFYDNMVDAWVNGTYYDLQFWKSPEEAPADKVLIRQTFTAK